LHFWRSGISLGPLFTNPKEKPMRITLFLLSATLLAGACNSKPNSTEAATDKAENASVAAKVKIKEAPEQGDATQAAVQKKSDAASAEPANNTAMSSESDNTAKAKKGWSKTAKGAVIGGVVGAGTGAVVNKKNRAVGAVVGGVAGAGVGAIIGNDMDKKDGRH